MFSLNLLKLVPTAISETFTRSFKYDRRLRVMKGINQPVRRFKVEEEDKEAYENDDNRIWRELRSLYRIDSKDWYKRPRKSNVIDDRPQMRGTVLKTVIKKPKKPNSANRKCVLLRLSNGREATAYVPGIGHNLQEHSQVLVKYHRVQDVPGLKLVVIRGVYDCSVVIKRTN